MSADVDAYLAVPQVLLDLEQIYSLYLSAQSSHEFSRCDDLRYVLCSLLYRIALGQLLGLPLFGVLQQSF